MDKDYVKKIIHKYLSGKATPKERRLIEEWYAYKTIFPTGKNQEENYERIKSEMWTSLEPNIYRPRIRKAKWFAYAAAILFVCGISSLYVYKNFVKTYTVQDYAGSVIAPGKSGATLTLADGSNINLTNVNVGQVALEEGVSISKSKDGFLEYRIIQDNTNKLSSRYNILATSNGETYQILLPDGSKVWLNSASSLSFDSNIGRENYRNVKLKGEGYFEIAKSPKPFIVETESQKVEVLGTHFNIDAYGEKHGLIKTTLAEGKVKVASKMGEKILSPGQQAVNNNGQLTMRKEDLEAVLAWKNGFFKFDGTLADVMQSISRWYNVDISYDENVPRELSLWGYVSRSNDLISVLKQLERTNKIKFEIQGRKVRVLPNINTIHMKN